MTMPLSHYDRLKEEGDSILPSNKLLLCFPSPEFIRTMNANQRMGALLLISAAVVDS